MKVKKLAVFFLAVMSFTISGHAFGAVDSASGKASLASKNLSYEQIKMAAESGDADAQYALGYMFYYGKGGAPKDAALAKSWINKAAQQKQPQAIKAIALMNAKQTQSSSKEMTTNSSPSQTNETVVADRSQNQRVENHQEDRDAEKNRKYAAGEEEPNDTTKSREKMTLVDMRHSQSESEAKKIAESSVSKLAESHESTDTLEGVYTLQLLGAFDKDQVKKMVRSHHLTQAKMYKTTFKNKDWYVLIYGQYKTKSEATLVAKRLENDIALKPWIKPIASVKHYKLSPVS